MATFNSSTNYSSDDKQSSFEYSATSSQGSLGLSLVGPAMSSSNLPLTDVLGQLQSLADPAKLGSLSGGLDALNPGKLTDLLGGLNSSTGADPISGLVSQVTAQLTGKDGLAAQLNLSELLAPVTGLLAQGGATGGLLDPANLTNALPDQGSLMQNFGGLADTLQLAQGQQALTSLPQTLTSLLGQLNPATLGA